LPGPIARVTMDPVTSPLIHKDSGHQAHDDPGEKNPSLPLLWVCLNSGDRLAITLLTRSMTGSNTGRQAA
jgi:hypothetical protein